MTGRAKVAAVIPAYRPSEALVRVVEGLAAAGLGPVVVIDDGSGPAYAALFDKLTAVSDRVAIERHARNLGKGAALKTGINRLCVSHPEVQGIVTLDADGQHAVADVVAVADRLLQQPDALILGTRRFDGAVPLRSRLGNSVTRFLFRHLVGQDITDTQTGLRGLPMTIAPDLLAIRTQRYEFELDMLVFCKHRKLEIVEVPIETIYIDDNASSHFSPLFDSMRIYFVLLRFLGASVITALIDNAIFIIAYSLGSGILFGQVAARAVALFANYAMVRRYVFFSDQSHSRTFPRYLAAVVGFGLLSYGLITLAVEEAGMAVIPAKIGAEGLIYLANFAVQREFIFARKDRTP